MQPALTIITLAPDGTVARICELRARQDRQLVVVETTGVEVHS